MDELEYHQRILASQDRTLKKLDEMNAAIASLGQFVNDLKTENAALREALDNIGNMAYTALNLWGGKRHCTLAEYEHVCVRILNAVNEALDKDDTESEADDA